uniref:Uncharacterized protein LOC104214543 isoform X1 n=1 Tax=Nicotiana sylvestris TaxID=4096 RepID=A0A1U7VC25_NICSY|nr:PREDICTED: uncharacterized protein LOC104214543 isoform X1 [Nicotiana sylvestris]
MCIVMKTTRMHLSVVQIFIATMVFLNHDEVEGLSKKDHEELERQLKLLNKLAVKTIKTVYGDIYDCIDFYQQPAFDHLLLKNHTYHPQLAEIQGYILELYSLHILHLTSTGMSLFKF